MVRDGVYPQVGLPTVQCGIREKLSEEGWHEEIATRKSVYEPGFMKIKGVVTSSVEFQSLLEVNSTVYPNVLWQETTMEGATISHVWNASERSMELHDQPKDCADYVVLRSRHALRGECSVNKD